MPDLVEQLRRNSEDARWKALEDFFGASWFTRKWVLQEVVLSTKVDVLFHDYRLSWEWVGLAAAILRTQYDHVIQDRELHNVYNAYLMYRLSDQPHFKEKELSSSSTHLHPAPPSNIPV